MLKTMTTEEKFRAAVNVIKSLPKDGPYQPSNEMKLTFYGLYKQATEGPCTEPKPSFFQVIAGYKWQAWNSLGQISKEEAMERYIAELKKIVETMSYSTDVASFMETLGPFYEYVDMPSKRGEAHHDTEDSTDVQAPDAEQQLCLQTPLSSATGDESADSAVSLEYEVPEKLSKVGVNGLHSPNGIVQEIIECSDEVHLLKGSLRNGGLRNGDVKRNGVVSRGTFPPPDPDEARGRPATPPAAATERERMLRAGRPVSSDTDSEDEYAMPPEEMSGDECVVMNGVTIEGTSSPSQHHHNDTSLELNTDPVQPDPLQFRMCNNSGASGLADTGSGSDRSSACDLRASSLVHSTTKNPHFSPFHSHSNDNPAFTLLENTPYMRSEGRNRNMSATPQVVGSGAVVREQGGPRGGGGGDDVVLVLRQMQGDLQAMTQCLQAHLNDISQCLAALNRTSIALQAHSEGGGGGGSGGAMSPVSDVVQRRQRQWWPFPELSPRSTFWLLLWPVLLHVAVHACKLAIRTRLRRKK